MPLRFDETPTQANSHEALTAGRSSHEHEPFRACPARGVRVSTGLAREPYLDPCSAVVAGVTYSWSNTRAYFL